MHSMIKSHPGVVAVPIAVSVMLSLTASVSMSAPQTFTEDFSTTEYRDSLNTTAWWDTTAGELKLFPLPRLTGSLDDLTSATVTVSGDHAYIVDGNFGLQVLDISDPATPVVAGSLETPGGPWGVDVSGDHAYVADGPAGLQAIDISDPANPVIVGSVATPDFASGVHVSGNYAYVADNFSGLQVIDISDPAIPFIAGSIDVGGFPWDLFVSGDYLYVADQNFFLRAVDISDPTNPILAGSLAMPGLPWDVYVSGHHAFVTTGDVGLQVVDVSDPASLAITGSVDTPDFAQGVFVSGDRVFIGDGGTGLQIIDISDPTRPALSGLLDTPGSAQGVFVSGEHAFVTDGTGFQVIQVFGILAPSLVSASTPQGAASVTVSGNRAYVAGELEGVQVFDITDPASLSLIGSVEMPGRARGLDVSGDHAYVGCDFEGLQVVNIADPTNPTLAGSLDTPGRAGAVIVSGDHAYVANGESGLQVINIADPTSPSLAGSLDTPGSAEHLSLSGNYAYVADLGSGIQVIDVSDPSSPTFAGSFATSGSARRVTVSGNHAYVAVFSSGLQILDVSDPTNPSLVGAIDSPGTTSRPYVSGDHAYVGDGPSGLLVIDVSDPANPIVVDSLDGLANSVYVSGEHAYIAGQSLKVVRVAQSSFAPHTDRAQSLSLDGSSDPILRARLATVHTDRIDWEVSANGGASWQNITSNGDWTSSADVGSDLRWRSIHTVTDHEINPTASELTLEWLNEFGPITSIVDVPDDQGGWVRVKFRRSGYDFADEVQLPVTGYQIYRRVDDESRAMRVEQEGAVPSRPAIDGTMMASFDLERIRSFEGRDFLVGGSSARGEFPPGTWEVIGNVFAAQRDSYTVAAPTLADSTVDAGTEWSVHFVTTHTTTPSIWFASAPDSGYSVDDIAPEVPGNLAFGDGTELQWDLAGEEDFDYHTVYGSDSPVFDETVILIDHTVNPSFDVIGQPHEYFHVTTSDHAGNESGAASVGNEASSTPDSSGQPSQFAFRHAGSSPFLADTAFEFDLPTAERVRLVIYDASGRQVRELVDGWHSPSSQSVIWDGMTDLGGHVSPGVYFARIRAGEFEDTMRLVRLR